MAHVKIEVTILPSIFTPGNAAILAAIENVAQPEHSRYPHPRRTCPMPMVVLTPTPL